MILQLRVDERLIHGQITTAWSKALAVSAIVVANDKAAADPIASRALLMTAPSGIKVVIKPIAQAIEMLKDPRAESMRLLVICDNPSDAITLVTALGVQEVNVANYVKKHGEKKIKITPNCQVTEEDAVLFRQLCDISPTIFSQIIPSLPKDDFSTLLKNTTGK